MPRALGICCLRVCVLKDYLIRRDACNYRAGSPRSKRRVTAMKLRFRWLSFMTLTTVVSAGLFAQSTPPKKKHLKPAAAATASQQDVESLRDLVQSQQKQIEAQ